jgi:hypothetical protein
MGGFTFATSIPGEWRSFGGRRLMFRWWILRLERSAWPVESHRFWFVTASRIALPLPNGWTGSARAVLSAQIAEPRYPGSTLDINFDVPTASDGEKGSFQEEMGGYPFSIM